MNDLSTDQHAGLIGDSVINGQYKQAVDQFEQALAVHCNPAALLAAIAERIGAGRTLIRIAAIFIERKQGQ